MQWTECMKHERGELSDGKRARSSSAQHRRIAAIAVHALSAQSPRMHQAAPPTVAASSDRFALLVMAPIRTATSSHRIGVVAGSGPAAIVCIHSTR